MTTYTCMISVRVPGEDTYCADEVGRVSLGILLELPFPPRKGTCIDFSDPTSEEEFMLSGVALTEVRWHSRVGAFRCSSSVVDECLNYVTRATDDTRMAKVLVDALIEWGWSPLDDEEQHPDWRRFWEEGPRKGTLLALSEESSKESDAESDDDEFDDDEVDEAELEDRLEEELNDAAVLRLPSASAPFDRALSQHPELERSVAHYRGLELRLREMLSAKQALLEEIDAAWEAIPLSDRQALGRMAADRIAPSLPRDRGPA